MVLFVTGFGGAAGPWIAGKIFDVTGSYNWAFIIGIIASALCVVAIWLLRKVEKAKAT
jgi:fucose permease